MKIVFICGSLELGKDGVGDYTRRLGAELILLGHEVRAIALYDPHIHDVFIGVQASDTISLPVLRLPSDATNRFQKAEEWIEAFKPDWVSLQFVPYAYHPKGLPFSLAKQFKKYIIKNRFFHIMFHETWIGIEGNAGIKRRITATTQKIIIKEIIKSLRPRVIHTQLPKTYFDLKEIMPAIKELPLFSNIEIAGRPAEKKPGILKIGFFSQAEASAPVIEFLISLGKNAHEMNMKLSLLFIGGNAARMKEAGNAFSKINSITSIEYTGFLAPEAISHALQDCTLGITIVPRHALGKSGSVAAFLQHGIPVAAPVVHPGRDPLEIGFFSKALYDAIVIEPAMKVLATAAKAAAGSKNEIGLPVIAKTFIADLVNNAHG